jgi:hypothetical protein
VYGSGDAKINVEIQPNVITGQLALAIFRYEDRKMIQEMDSVADYLLCNEQHVPSVCKQDELGKFHIKDGPVKSPMMNELIKW